MSAFMGSSAALELMSQQEAVRDAIARGQFHIVSLESVRTALGVRWGRNEGLVEDFVVRSFQRMAATDDMIVRVNEADFVLIQPSRSPMSALSRAAALARQTLSHFLGEVRPENVEVSIIQQISAGVIEAVKATQEQLDEAALAERPAAQQQSESPPWEAFGVKRPPRRIVTFKRPEGGDLEALHYCEPIWNAAHSAVVAFRLRSLTFYRPRPHTRQRVAPEDLTARTHAVIAQQSLCYARELLQAPENRHIALSVPLALDVFAHSASRIAIAGEFRSISADIRRRLLIELAEVPRDVIVGRVVEAVAQVKPFVRRVTVRLPSSAVNHTDWEWTGADGLVIDLGDWAAQGRVEPRLTNLVRYTRRAGMFAAVDGVRDPHMAALARTSGVAEIAGDFIVQAVGEEMRPRPFRLEYLLGECARLRAR